MYNIQRKRMNAKRELITIAGKVSLTKRWNKNRRVLEDALKWQLQISHFIWVHECSTGMERVSRETSVANESQTGITSTNLR